ncbi:MAG: acetoacetate decarboxylase family protein [Candidatus Binatia bacterium]
MATPVTRPQPNEFLVEGRLVRLPVAVRDASTMFATYVVPSAIARRLFPQSAIQLAEIVPGRGLLTIAAIEYRDNDLGRYNEIAVAFPVRHGAGRPWPLFGMAIDFAAGRGGVYIHRLPVTTAFSCAAGREIWGFPKIVADIVIEDRGGERVATLSAGGAHVLTLSVVRRGRRRYADRPLDAFAIRDGVVWRTPFVSSGDRVGVRLGGARLELGGHAIAGELRALGLPKRPLLSGSVERFSARFEAPTPAA